MVVTLLVLALAVVVVLVARAVVADGRPARTRVYLGGRNTR